MADDPFFIVKREVEQSLTQVSNMFTQRNSPQNQNNKRTDNDIRDRLQNIVADLDELDDTIKIVQGNPARFKIDKREIDDRKSFVGNTRKLIEDMRFRLNTKESRSETSPSTAKPNISRAIEDEQMQQQMIMQNQDRQMDEVVVTVRNLKEIGRVMGNELDDQTRLLGEVEEHVDATQNKLQDGMKRMKDFIQANSDIKQQITIIVLIIALVVLMILVLSF
ncbi:syntaxin 6, N-terminal-domain-containing protein [Globomyces pollinis-pini]|nr:syntaxin 6, N-terminal-domain-containing protein [Globomyces pollinis-pini]